VILDVSLKVLPRPASETTLAFQHSASEAIATMNRWAGQPLPLSAAAHSDETLYMRLSGSESAVRAARARLGGEVVDEGDLFWEEIREQRHVFFQSREPLWRLSVPPASAPLDLPGQWLIDWGGAQRWLVSTVPEATIRAAAIKAGGYAIAFRNHPSATRDSLTPSDDITRALHARIQQAFDPKGLFNPTKSVAAA
jgi:glycolate oxidase FAD binding subunit